MEIKSKKEISILFLLLCALPVFTCAQESPVQTTQGEEEYKPVHWAYSAFFGTGWYKIDDTRSVYVLKIPPRFTIGEAGFDEEGKRKLQYEIHTPLTLGLHQVDDIPGIIEPENFGTASFTPGLEIEIPLDENWSLRPYLNIGYGYDFDTDESAWIYYAGLKSRYSLFREKVRWDFIANVFASGFDSSEDKTSDIGGIMLGVEADHKWPWSKSGYVAHWHLAYTRLTDGLQFYNQPSGDTPGYINEINDVFEVGLAFSPPNGKWDFWLYKPHQLGLGFEFSPEFDYFAIKWNSRSWFTR